MTEPSSPASGTVGANTLKAALSLARHVVGEFALSDLEPLLLATENQSRKKELNLAVFGRFKAGKSSFLNHLLRRRVLPVGVVPVTSVVTLIGSSEKESAHVRRISSGHLESIPLESVAAYISEAENPGNEKNVDLVQVRLPEMQRYQGLQFVDTPGLESLLLHNTETTTAWSPNVDLAIVAVGVDPPLTRQDVQLIEQLLRFTPKLTVLLTKVDLLDENERQEVLRHVASHLDKRFGSGIRVFPYSIRAGFESLRDSFEKDFLLLEFAAREQNRLVIMKRKLEELLRSAEEYLALALRAAQKTESERDSLGEELRELESSLPDRKLQLQLVEMHTARQFRARIEEHLRKKALPATETRLLSRFEEEFGSWSGSFGKLLAKFESWLEENLETELSCLSLEESAAFVEPFHTARQMMRQQLQSVRDHFSERLRQLTGSGLATAETEIEVSPPASPDISVGKIFDRNWELVSLLIPMSLVRGMVKKRFAGKIESETYKNISRLISQWEEALAEVTRTARIEAQRRLDEYVGTVRRMLSAPNGGASESLTSALRRLRAAREELVKIDLAIGETAFLPKNDAAK
jgi:GTP-binding protein EngB required for normal cell division